MQQNISEVSTYIILAGAKRLPDLEAEIFADVELTTLYLNNLCKELDWYTNGVSNAWAAYNYADDIIKGRWLEAEPIITTNLSVAYYYASRVAKRRLHEAESLIKTDKYYWKWYCRRFDITTLYE